MFRYGRGRGGAGRGAGRAAGDSSFWGYSVCSCPSCGYTEPHARGIPCFTKTCPKCGTRMAGARCR